jgi:hypothetical protein
VLKTAISAPMAASSRFTSLLALGRSWRFQSHPSQSLRVVLEPHPQGETVQQGRSRFLEDFGKILGDWRSNCHACWQLARRSPTWLLLAAVAATWLLGGGHH